MNSGLYVFYAIAVFAAIIAAIVLVNVFRVALFAYSAYRNRNKLDKHEYYDTGDDEPIAETQESANIIPPAPEKNRPPETILTGELAR